MTEAITTAADAVHWLAIDADWGEPRLKLVCTAARGAHCRKRHPDPDVEEWLPDDPDLIDTDRCWAVEWAEDAGWESVQVAEGAEFPPIPVSVTCDEGPVLAPILPHPTLPEPERVKPSREDVARTPFQWDIAPDHPQPHPLWDDPHSARLRDLWLSAADAVLALMPGRTVEEVKAEALEEAASVYDVVQISGVFFGAAEYSRAWLRARAASLRGESNG